MRERTSSLSHFHQRMDRNQLWQAALGEIELSISKASFVTWFQNTEIAQQDGGLVTVSVPNNFVREWLENKYNKIVLRALRNISQEIKEVRYIIGTPKLVKPAPAVKKAPIPFPVPEEQFEFKEFSIDKETNLNPRYNFDSFIVGSSNELAHAAAISVTENLASSYNPLFIYGGVGLGKTHLLQSIGNEIVRNDKRKKVCYVSSEKFTSEVVQAIRDQRTQELKDRYRKVDLLIIDDIQFLSGKEKTQEEFFHTFNALYEHNKQIVLSSDRPPKAIPTLEERLRSRFEGGMMADISYPDFETRLAILKRKASERQFVVAPDILEYIATHVQKNVRELEGALNRVIAASRINKQAPQLLQVKEMLNAVIFQPKRVVSAKQVIKMVASFYDINEHELINRSRRKEVVYPRQIAMYLLREELRTSYPAIGTKLGGRDHTTAIHACEKIERELAQNENLNKEIEMIRNRIYSE